MCRLLTSGKCTEGPAQSCRHLPRQVLIRLKSPLQKEIKMLLSKVKKKWVSPLAFREVPPEYPQK